VDGTTPADWRDWVDTYGTGGQLLIDRTELLPPGLRAAFELEGFELFFPDHRPPSWMAIKGDRVLLRLDAGLLSPETIEAGSIRRSMATGHKAIHEYFALPQMFWGGGHAKRMLRNAVLLYEQLEIPRVELSAEGLGKYIWAVCGFDFRDDETREAVNTAMRLFANELGIEGLPEFQRPWGALALDTNDDGEPVYVPTGALQRALRERGEIQLVQGVPPSRISPSKALLLYSRYDSWEGVLDIRRETPSREQFEIYVP
jgi:hypothetical protein